MYKRQKRNRFAFYALPVQLEYISKFLFSKLIALNSLNFFAYEMQEMHSFCDTFDFHVFLL